MNKKQKRMALAIAGVVLILSHMAVHHFTTSSSATDFLSGVLLGMGLVLVIAALLIKKDKSQL